MLTQKKKYITCTAHCVKRFGQDTVLLYRGNLFWQSAVLISEHIRLACGSVLSSSSFTAWTCPSRVEECGLNVRERCYLCIVVLLGGLVNWRILAVQKEVARYWEAYAF